MANAKIAPDSFVPYGEMMRELGVQTFISDADVKTVLRKRGVFIKDSDKLKSVPILACTLLSPSDFQVLIERQSIKEDSLKSAGSGKLTPSPGFGNLADFIYNELKPRLNNLISREEGLRNNYKLIGIPSVASLSEDEVEINFTIERSNFNKSWVNHKSTFNGSVVFKKDSKDIVTRRFFTSEETKGVVNKIGSLFEKVCKEKKVISEEQVEKRIRFDDFDNSNRIKFLLKLFNSEELRKTGFEGKEISDFEFCADSNKELPSDLIWMANKNKLIFQGKKIENTFFLEQPQYHPYLVVWRMIANYKVSFPDRGVEGSVQMDFHFAEYGRDQAPKSPLEIKFGSALNISKPDNINFAQKESLRREILIKFEDLKNLLFERYFTGS